MKTQVDPDFAHRVARIALEGIARRYPYHLQHVMHDDADARPPSELTPLFAGCFDWHSAVHSHWCLLRLLRCLPDASINDEIRETLSRRFTAENVTAEVGYLIGPDRGGFERPYGLAWMLQLSAELHEWKDDPDAPRWRECLRPLEKIAAARFSDWLPKLTHPVRSGEHSQTAFAMGLAVDWAETVDASDMQKLLRQRTLDFHFGDVNAPLDYEPSGHDFLSPSLAVVDLMRRVLSAEEFAAWLGRFSPVLSATSFQPEQVSDPRDGKLSHLHGLNLSRAWMLEGIAGGLPAGDARIPDLDSMTVAHRDAGLAAVTDEHYSISHWLGSFAVYLLTERGLPTKEDQVAAPPIHAESPSEMILEGIVTTRNADGEINVAPMGPLVDERMQTLHLRPFKTSQTYQNLKRNPEGVFHVVDDVLLLAEAAIGSPREIPAMFPAKRIDGDVIAGACRWYEFRIDRFDDSEDRTDLFATVLHAGRLRDFFGFHRAKHAVIEAAILATRLHLLPEDEVREQLAAFRSPIEKTAGPRERAAFRLIVDYVDRTFS